MQVASSAQQDCISGVADFVTRVLIAGKLAAISARHINFYFQIKPTTEPATDVEESQPPRKLLRSSVGAHGFGTGTDVLPATCVICLKTRYIKKSTGARGVENLTLAQTLTAGTCRLH